MKCQSQPSRLKNRPVQINDVWEVRLSLTIMQQIRAAAATRRCTLSWITRYCVFRLAERHGLQTRHFIRRTVTEVAANHQSAAECHRHLVCFYGEDVKHVRLAALEMQISVSAFIRLALWLYLPRVAMDIHSEKGINPYDFFWRGIKRWYVMPHLAINELGLPTLRRYLFSGFPPQLWWDIPP